MRLIMSKFQVAVEQELTFRCDAAYTIMTDCVFVARVGNTSDCWLGKDGNDERAIRFHQCRSQHQQGEEAVVVAET